MPPRYAYWTIIAGGLPTAFRAADRDELMPTFHRIKEKHPDAQMKYFARGKLWESDDAARAALRRGGGDRRNRPSGGDRGGRPPGNKGGGRPAEARGRDWRPGGEHRDPRQKFIDARKQRNAVMRKERWNRKNAERKPWVRGQDTDEPTEPQPPRPRGPNREPRPSEEPEPTPPPRPTEPVVPPPGPAEQGREPSRRRFQPRAAFRKNPRRP